jgi:APA family basic amino acid/polyamine antiporter
VLLYLFSSNAVSQILSPQTTATSLTPYADALKANWGETAANLAAVGIAVAAIGGLNSNVLCAGEVGYAMGLRGDLPRVLGRANAANTPTISILLASALAIILILSNSSKSTADLFVFVGLLSTSVTLFVYFLGAIAAWRTRPSVHAHVAIAVSILFSLFAFYGAGLRADLWGLALIAIGLAIRWLMHRFSSSEAIPPEAAPAAPPGSSA